LTVDIGSIDLNLLAIFDAIERERNITLAANRVGLSQPAMSNALARLRQVFKDPLFVRAGRSMQPTPFAQRLAEPIRQSCLLINHALTMENSFRPNTSNRTFCFYMTDIGEVVNLPVIVDHLQKIAPLITVKVASILQKDLPIAMSAGEIDIAIGPFPALRAGFFEQRLYSDSFVCIARSDHPQIGNTLSHKQFTRTPHVVVESAAHEPFFERLIKRHKIERQVAATVPHFMALPMVIERSDLIATIPLRAARSFSNVAKIKFLKPPIKIPNYDIKQHWHERFHFDPVNKWMRGVLAALFLGADKAQESRSPE